MLRPEIIRTSNIEGFKCANCGQASLPYRIFKSCQHPVCPDCASQSSTVCLKCKVVSSVDAVPFLDDAVRASLTFECKACQLSISSATAPHLCENTIVEWRKQYPHLPSTHDRAYHDFQGLAADILAANLKHESFIQFVNEAMQHRPPPPTRILGATSDTYRDDISEVPATVAQNPFGGNLGGRIPRPLSPSPPLPPAAPAKGALRSAELHWDFDNINPRFLGCTVTVFYSEMIKHLKTMGIDVFDATAYLVSNKDYGTVPDKLGTLQVRMQLCGTKQESTDREIAAAMARSVRDKNPGRIVLVSSDKDFNAAVQQATRAGWEVIVVHNATANTDHERQLLLHAATGVSVHKFIKAEHVNPIAPQAYVSPDAFARTVIDVDGERVNVTDLITTPAVIDIANGPESSTGRWCRNPQPHSISQCPFVHRLPQKVPIEGKMIDVSKLWRNRFVSWIVANPAADGKWCTNPHKDHVPEWCQFAHKLPGVYIVEGEAVNEADIVKNDAFRRLVQNPTASVRRCPYTDDHDAEQCVHGIHMKR